MRLDQPTRAAISRAAHILRLEPADLVARLAKLADAAVFAGVQHHLDAPPEERLALAEAACVEWGLLTLVRRGSPLRLVK